MNAARSALFAGTIFCAQSSSPASVRITRLALRLPSQKSVSTSPRDSRVRSAELTVCLL